jgi:flagellar motor switch protein FliN/FliY
MSPVSSRLPELLHEPLLAAVVRACQALLGQPCLARIEDPAPEVPTEPAVRLRVRLPAPAAGSLDLILEATDARLLAALLAPAAASPQEPSPEDLRAAAARLLQQIAAHLLPAEPSVLRTEDAPMPPETARTGAIRLERAEGESLRIWLQWDPALEASLVTSRQSRERIAAEARSADTGGSDADAPGSNLELLLDVELEASIRFGQREMLLKDVLELRPGAVIELARQVDEPAELLVAGRVMARGEVVVIEGNYGLRITEILSPAERYQAIRTQTRS